MILLALILIPLIAAALVPFAPSKRAKWIGVGGTMAPIVAFLAAANQFPWGAGQTVSFIKTWDWVPSLGLQVSLGADSVSMLLIGLTVLLGPILMFCSFSAVSERERTYYGWLLVLQGAMTGVFAARDAVLFYIFFEFTLVPLYILISLFGSTNRKAAATKFFLFTFTGSIITLAGVIFIAWFNTTTAGGGNAWSLSLPSLAQAGSKMPLETQKWVFWALMLGFAIKVPLFPLHTWLPLAHTEAPTAGSVVLAGVLLKLGTYGMFRFALMCTPEAAVHFAPVVGALATIAIVYGGLICWVQTDAKKLVAYSSVSHLGFCVLGLFALNSIGLSGSILYMINHGLSTGALFLLVGMIYERYHTRNMRELGGLAAKMPIWATFMVFFTMSSVGLPGLNGFVGEFLCLMGAFQADSIWNNLGSVAGTPGNLGFWYALVAGTGLIVTAMYLLYLVGKVVFGPLVEPHGHGEEQHGHGHGGSAAGHAGSPHGGGLPTDLNWREIGVLAPLAVACLVLGLYPKPLLKTLEGPTQEMASLMHSARERLEAIETEQGMALGGTDAATPSEVAP